MYKLSVFFNLGTMILWVRVESLEAMPCRSLSINPPLSKINKLQLPNECYIDSVKHITQSV